MGVLLEFLTGTSEMFLGFMVLFMVVGLAASGCPDRMATAVLMD
jgi:hypothetical protein